MGCIKSFNGVCDFANKQKLNALACMGIILLANSFSTQQLVAEDKPAPIAPVAPVVDTKKTDKKTDPADEATAKKNFEVDYEAALAAVAEKNWPLVRQKLTSAMAALGTVNDTRKSTAQILLNKAERLLIKDDALFTASELLRLKQWVEAEEAFRKVVDVSGETETLRKSILACRAGLESEYPGLKTASDLLKEKKWKEATDAFNKESETVGGIRIIRDGLASAQLGIESDDLLKKAPEYLKNKRWDDAFNAYKRLLQILGNTEDIQKGISAAQAGYAEEHKTSAEIPKP